MIDPKSSFPRLPKVLDGLTSERHKVVLGIALQHAMLESETVWDVDGRPGRLSRYGERRFRRRVRS